MSRRILSTTFFFIICTACSIGSFGQEQNVKTEPVKETQNRCGDDVCDGPENAENCPEDCGLGILVSPAETADAGEQPQEDGSKKFRIVMTIHSESNLTGIAGSDAQSYYEPVMTGYAEIEATFPAAGGAATSQTGSITLTDYHGKGPNCSVEVVDGMIGSTSNFTFSDIQWDPAGRMTFSAEVNYDALNFDTIWTCPPQPTVTIEEYPMYKLVGIFNEKMRSLSLMTDQGFAAQEMVWGPNNVFQSTVDIVIEETR